MADTELGDTLALQEKEIYAKGKECAAKNDPQGIRALLNDNKAFFDLIPKARTAKIVRTLIELCESIPGTENFQIELCKDCIDWCLQESRTFLKYRMQLKLSTLYLKKKLYQQGLEILSSLCAEVKKFDDKLLLVEIYLLESRYHYEIENIPKSKAALTAGRTNANAINCPPLLQAELDFHNGILNIADEDYRTAYSYFYESLEAYHIHLPLSNKAMTSFLYMLLSKILINKSSDVQQLINGKYGMVYRSAGVEMMKKISQSNESRSVHDFIAVVKEYDHVLQENLFIRKQVLLLQGILLESNIQKLLEPYSKIDVKYICEYLQLDMSMLVTKISEMILDGKIRGTFEQSKGVLILFKEHPVSSIYDSSIQTIQSLSKAVDALQRKANVLSV